MAATVAVAVAVAVAAATAAAAACVKSEGGRAPALGPPLCPEKLTRQQ